MDEKARTLSRAYEAHESFLL